jgi:hypothetical protein
MEKEKVTKFEPIDVPGGQMASLSRQRV